MSELKNFGKSYDAYYELSQNLFVVGNSYYKDVMVLHKRKSVGCFQTAAYQSQFVIDGALYFPFHDVLDECVKSGVVAENLKAALWQRMLARVDEPIAKQSGAPFESACLSDLFVEMYCKRFNKDWSMGSVRDKVRVMYLALLTAELLGTVMEAETYAALVNRLGSDRVVWAGNDVEQFDIDLYVDGLPVSVKNLNAFNRKSFNEYRADGGERVVMYVCADLDVRVPGREISRGAAGERRWWYDEYSADELDDVIESLGGKPAPVATYEPLREGSFLDVVDDGFGDLLGGLLL